jgi:hypothetical protein
MRVFASQQNQYAGARRDLLVPRAGGGGVNVASRELQRTDLDFAFEHDAFLFAPHGGAPE